MNTLRNSIFFRCFRRKKQRKSGRDSIERMEEEKFENLKLNHLVKVKTFAQGTWGTIDLVYIKNEPNHCFALKKIKKSKLKAEVDRINVFNEKQILSSVNCDFILKFYKTFKDSQYLYIMTECCYGGDLFAQDAFDEDGSRFYVGCIAEALDYLHSRHIVHRDLKLENLVLDAQGYLKLIDFGMARRLEEGEITYSFCGTVEYMAPEVIDVNKPGYDVAVDLWALGILTYEFLFGNHPMLSKRNQNIRAKIMKGIDAVAFPSYASGKAVDFIKKLCDSDPEERLGYGPGGFDDLRNHCWFEDFDWQALRERKLTPPIVPELSGVTDTSYFVQQIKKEGKDSPDSPDEDSDSDWAKDF